MSEIDNIEYEPTHMGEIPFEQMRNLLSALIEHLGLTIEAHHWYDGPPEYRFKTKGDGR